MSYERKTKMKKIIALLLALVMVFALVACGGNKDAGTDADADVNTDAGADTNTDAEAGDSIEGGAEADGETAGDAEIPEEVVVMTHDEFVAAELDAKVVVETYVQDKQGWWEKDGVGGVGSFYTQAEDGAYFLYDMPCSQEDYDKLVPGTKIRVTGYKAEWAGEVEIVDATFEILDGNFVAEPLDVTSLLGTDELIAHQNEFVSFSTMKVEPSVDAEGNEVPYLYKWDGSGTAGDDIYFNVSVGGAVYNFVVESYLRGDGTDVYEAVEALTIGTIIDMEGFLYWYEGANPHITSVVVNPLFASVDDATNAAVSAYLQGTWEYTDAYGIYYEIIFDGVDFYVTSTINGESLSNEGTFQVCAGAILVTYTNGMMAYMEYEWDGTDITNLYGLVGLE